MQGLGFEFLYADTDSSGKPYSSQAAVKSFLSSFSEVLCLSQGFSQGEEDFSITIEDGLCDYSRNSWIAS